MDKETREFLENMQKEMQDFRKETNNRFDGVEGRLGGMETRLEGVEGRLDGLERGQEEIKSLIGELEPRNANRHLELKTSIDHLIKDLSTVEIVTASNYSDIARLKNIK